MTTHGEVWCVISTVEDQRPPGLEHVSCEVHGGDDDGPQRRRLVPHGVVGPREEGGLDAVDGARPVERAELAGYRNVGHEQDDADADGGDGHEVAGNPSSAEDIGCQGPDERAGDSDGLENRGEVVEIGNGI